MIRGLIFLIIVLIIVQALRSMVRSAVHAYHENSRDRGARALGDEMVLDPQCRTYIVKERAVPRTIRGDLVYFCSDDCARRYQDRHPS